MFVERTRELAKPNELYASDRFEMAVVYGRCRVGKATLINGFCRDKKAIYFVGVEMTEKENLSAFSQAVWSTLMPGQIMPTFGSYRELLLHIT